jgi:photosystem II stability/assembly factor-like uncharacterized protein
MRKFLFTFHLFFFCLLGFGQWVWENPIPQGNSLTCIKFFNADTGFAIGDNGTILKTVDAGYHWSYTNLGCGNWLLNYFKDNDKRDSRAPASTFGLLMDFAFPSINNGFIVGTNGIVLRANDCGNTWMTQDLNVTDDLYSIYFTDSNYGFIAGDNGAFFKTKDGGNTWQKVITNSNYSLRRVYFTDSLHGFIFGFIPNWMSGDGFKLETFDGGSTWNYTDIGYTIYDLSVINDSLWYVLAKNWFSMDYYNYVFKTNDNGSTLELLYNTSNSYLSSICFTDSINGFIVGQENKYTNNGGLTWNNINFSYVDSTYTLGQCHSVFFTDHNNGVICGEYGMIYKSTDAGNVWTTPTPTFSSLSSVFFPDHNTGFAVGSMSTVLKTVDRGDHWQYIYIQPWFDNFSSVFFTDAITGYVAGQKIYKTYDSGNSWSLLNLPASAHSFKSLVFVTENMGIAVGIGTIIKTIDAGQTWTTITTGVSGIFYCVSFPTHTIGYICGSGGKILKTTDGGDSWTLLSSGTTADLGAIYFTDPETGYASGKNGIILKTTDGGITWNIIYSSQNIFFRSIFFTDENTGYFVDGVYNNYGEYCNRVFKTEDAGITFDSLYTNSSTTLNAIFFTDKNTGILVGANGTIFKTTNGINGTDETTIKLNENPGTIFPNPATSLITIACPENQRLNLSVYNIVGELVLQREINNSTNDVDIRSLAKGIYIIKVSGADWTVQRKLIKE